jgi:hypothetical protein
MDVGTARAISWNEIVMPDDEKSKVIGGVEILLSPTKLGEFSGNLQVNLEGGVTRMIQLPLTGIVEARIGLSPAIVTLPRRTKDGLTYESRVLCRDRTGAAIDIFLDESDGPVRVELMPSEFSAPMRILRVQWTDLAAGPTDHRVPIRIQHQGTGTSEVVYLHVRFDPEQGD